MVCAKSRRDIPANAATERMCGFIKGRGERRETPGSSGMGGYGRDTGEVRAWHTPQGPFNADLSSGNEVHDSGHSPVSFTF